jgi:hypothetical protein
MLVDILFKTCRLLVVADQAGALGIGLLSGGYGAMSTTPVMSAGLCGMTPFGAAIRSAIHDPSSGHPMVAIVVEQLMVRAWFAGQEAADEAATSSDTALVGGDIERDALGHSPRSIQALEKDIRDWIAAWNDNPKPFIWTKTAEEIFDRLASYLQRIGTCRTDR